MDKRISQLELVTELDENDVLPIVNNNTTKKVKVSQLPKSETNLSYLPDPANGVIDNDNGTSATIPLTTSTDAGLFSPAEKTKLAGIETGAQANVNADWNATTGDAQILNKPSIPSAQVNSDWNSTSGVSQILNKPTIPASQVNSDWDATSGVAQILNKPTIPSSATFVPYTGATSDLDLGTYNLNADHISLNVSPSGAGFVVGATEWNNELGSSQTLLKGGNVTLKNGVDLVARIVNKVVPNTTLTKANYQVVKVSGASGQRLAVDLARANTDLNSADTLGVVCETITTNQEGFILTVGQLLDVNTTGSLQGETWADGDVLYLSPSTAGRMTNIKPTGATGHIVVLGYVEYAHANNGKIYVKIMNGWELDELHNVFIGTPLNNQVLTYESSTDLWKNKSLGTILGYTPYKYVDSTRINVTGTLTESILNTIVIAGGTFNSNDIMKVIWKLAKTTAFAIPTVRLRMNTTNTLTGATLLATSTMSTTNRSGFYMRHFDLISGTINGYDSSTSAGTDMTTSNGNPTTNTYNTSNTIYLFTTIQLANVSDSITSNFVNITN
jgi:nitrogen fixation protein